jgi:hypothetical protein
MFCFEQCRPPNFGIRLCRSDGGGMPYDTTADKQANMCVAQSAVCRRRKHYGIAKNEISTAKWRLSGSDWPSA